MNLIRLRVTKPGAPLLMHEVMLDPNGPISISIGSRGQLYVPGAEWGIEPPYNIEVSVTPFDKPCAEGK